MMAEQQKKNTTYTLCVIHTDTEMLLGMKQRRLGAGKWNSFGGRVEEGESIEEAMVREVQEECGLTPINAEAMGVITFLSPARDPLDVHIFRTKEFEGTVRESDEMVPQWFPIGDLPWGDMWSSDTAWLPYLIQGKKFRGTMTFNEADEVINTELDFDGRAEPVAE